MKITWDENKNTLNKSKHGISFEAAQFVFHNPLFFSQQDRFVNSEERWQAIGLVGGQLCCLQRTPGLIPRTKNTSASFLQDLQKVEKKI